MAIDPRAQAYAKHHAPLFVSRYIDAARAGRSDIIPDAIRPSVVAYVTGTVPRTPPVDVGAWVTEALYQYRVNTGGDAPLPPEFSASRETVAQAALRGAAQGAARGAAVAGGSLVRSLLRGLLR